MGRVDVALEEYKALRAEILVHQQAQTTIVGVALTATAAIGGVAFAAKSGDPQRLEILLALPLVLSGLGLAYLTHTHGVMRIGTYLRTELWPALQTAASDDPGRSIAVPSWEQQPRPRGLRRILTSIGGWLSFLPGLMIFGAPSVAALSINSSYALHPAKGDLGLQRAWWIDLILTGVAVLLLLLVGRHRGDHASAATARRPPGAAPSPRS